VKNIAPEGGLSFRITGYDDVREEYPAKMKDAVPNRGVGFIFEAESIVGRLIYHRRLQRLNALASRQWDICLNTSTARIAKKIG
jgi:hypothetical protein